jgi:CheY-like chemotaxis protein
MTDGTAEPKREPTKDQRLILVADDDQDMREEIGRALRGGHLRIIEMDSGDRLLRYLRGCVVSGGQARTPDVIVSDIRMPGCSGIDVLRVLREFSIDIPVILMTAFGDAATHQEAKQLGATAIFDKPFDAEDLCAAVLCALSSRG